MFATAFWFDIFIESILALILSACPIYVESAKYIYSYIKGVPTDVVLSLRYRIYGRMTFR